MKRDSAAPPPKKGAWVCCDGDFSKKFPALSQGMCDVFWDDGKPRTPWTLTVRFELGSCNLCLNDKEGSRGAYTSGESLSDALTLLDHAIAAESLSWRRWKK